MNMYMVKLETMVECANCAIKWTLVRPPRLMDGASQGGFKARDNLCFVGARHEINRVDLAKFLAHEIEHDLWLFKHPTISY